MAGSELSTAQPGRFPARLHPIPASLSMLRPTWSVPARCHPHALWVHAHVRHLAQHVVVIPGPAQHAAELRRNPRWR